MSRFTPLFALIVYFVLLRYLFTVVPANGIVSFLLVSTPVNFLLWRWLAKKYQYDPLTIVISMIANLKRRSISPKPLRGKSKCWDARPILFLVDLFLPKEHSDEVVDDLKIRYRKRFKSYGQFAAVVWLVRHGILSVKDARLLRFGARARAALMKLSVGAWLVLKYDLVREAVATLVTRQ